ncbi:hypothetical protein [Pseudomonas indica]|uniref:hypothetical protein n=1 Tax=Pseudomonas indica TaxID=137658 RepID=UPI003FD677FF
MAVQLEPITFSGERITCGVAVALLDGSAPKVVGTLSIEPLEAVFGQYGRHLFKLAGTVNAELQDFLATGGKLTEWVPPMDGVYTGQVVPTRNTSLDAIIRSALRHSSLFSAKANDATSSEPVDRSLSRFQDHIKRIVMASREGFKVRFNTKMSLYGGKAKVPISYVGTHLAINLVSLDPTLTSHSQQRDAAHRKINQLLAIRDINIGHRKDHLMLGLWTPARELSKHQEELLDTYTTELEFASNKSAVQFVLADGTVTPDQAAMPFAKRILEDA